MTRRRVRLGQAGWMGMSTDLEEYADPRYAHYLYNVVPKYDHKPSPLIGRPKAGKIGTGTLANVLHCGSWRKTDGTLVTWALTSAPILYTFDWSTTTWTSTVSAANFSTATISVANVRPFVVRYFNTLVFSDGTNTPWTWDGTSGAGGLTKLSNAPVAYGKPAVYYAKLFFIKNSERDTIVWSEENAANTGYEASGYNNAWTLAQTGGGQLEALHGTNEALVVWRAKGITAIRGAVNDTFVTTGTTDAISQTVGTISPHSITEHSGNLWFWGADHAPYVMRPGGTPERLPWVPWQNGSSSTEVEPFGYDDVAVGQHNSRAGLPTIVGTWAPSMDAQPYEQVWFGLAAGGTGPSAVAVFSANTFRQLAWYEFAGTTRLAGLAPVYDSNTNYWLIGCFEEAATSYFLGIGYQGLFGGTDSHATTGSATFPTYRMILGPYGAGQDQDWQFDAVGLHIRGTSTGLLTVACLTSRYRNAATAPSAQSVSVSNSASYVETKRYPLGLNQSGRWIRFVILMSAEIARFGLDQLDLDAFPAPEHSGTAV